MLNALQVADKKVLLVLAEANENVHKSGRNLPNVRIELARNLNTYAILNCEVLLMEAPAVEQLHAQLA